ncbi:glycosyltransferase [Phocaeicola vulgatus]|uniref:glycosyltransferase n=2 Tax=Phocaeicola vulgatus TaxID=821 RepID=UPI0020B2DAAD|nr:glycosyltransferase [Phocaeicola vulgatus]
MDETLLFFDGKMKRLVQINPVVRVNTSTGRIMQEIGELAMQNGWESYLAYSYGRDGIKPCKSKLLPVGNRCSVAWHGVQTRLFDRHGLASGSATRTLVKRIEVLQPDVIHIHNIHGYFLNYKVLFDFLANCDIPVVWTIHDCWLYTGHCYYYSYVGCDRWKSGCHDCPQRREFPASWLFDRSRQNYRDKRAAFTSISPDRLTLVPVSEWIKGEMQQSFFSGYHFQVIHNGIDTNVFRGYDTSEIRMRYGLGDRHVLLGVASIWSREKGLDDFIKLSTLLREDEVIVLVGIKPEDKKRLPFNVVAVSRTENVHQLAELYSAAEAFVNPTWQDNYPTVNLEALACGTPVVTYRTGGSVEAVTDDTGFIVEQGDVEGLLDAFRIIVQHGKAYYEKRCREYALAHFRKEECYKDYLRLYDKLTGC